MQSLLANQLTKTAFSNAPALFALNRILGSNMPALSTAANVFFKKYLISQFHTHSKNNNINNTNNSNNTNNTNNSNNTQKTDIISQTDDVDVRRYDNISYFLNLYKNKIEDTNTFHPGSQGFVPGIPTKIHEHFKEWLKTLTPDETTSIRNYTFNGHNSLNTALRKDSTLNSIGHPPILTMAENLHNALNKARIPEDMIVYRRTKAPLWGLTEGQMDGIVGKVFTENGFLSTTVNKDIKIVDSNILLKIEVPKGAQGAYIGDLSWYSGEDEILFNKNQKLHVTSTNITRQFSNINCKLLPQEKDLMLRDEQNF